MSTCDIKIIVAPECILQDSTLRSYLRGRYCVEHIPNLYSQQQLQFIVTGKSQVDVVIGIQIKKAAHKINKFRSGSIIFFQNRAKCRGLGAYIQRVLFLVHERSKYI